MFVKNYQIAEIANAMQPYFEVGSLHSKSPINQIVPVALEELADRGYPQRRSLAVVISKMAQATWVETMLHTRQRGGQV